jgi:hypothetical protein
MTDPLKSPGEELYEFSRMIAPTFNVWLKAWDELSREERLEWEVMADEQVGQDHNE